MTLHFLLATDLAQLPFRIKFLARVTCNWLSPLPYACLILQPTAINFSSSNTDEMVLANLPIKFMFAKTDGQFFIFTLPRAFVILDTADHPCLELFSPWIYTILLFSGTSPLFLAFSFAASLGLLFIHLLI